MLATVRPLAALRRCQQQQTRSLAQRALRGGAGAAIGRAVPAAAMRLRARPAAGRYPTRAPCCASHKAWLYAPGVAVADCDSACLAPRAAAGVLACAACVRVGGCFRSAMPGNHGAAGQLRVHRSQYVSGVAPIIPAALARVVNHIKSERLERARQ